MQKADHFYTPNVDEANAAIQGAGYQAEGAECFVFTENKLGPLMTPVYRFFDGSDHFYTTNKAEGDQAKGYHFERIAFYVKKNKSSGSNSKFKWIPLFRMFGKDPRDQEHFYTTAQDRSSAYKAGYVDEGILGYVLAEIPPSPFYAAPLVRIYRPSKSNSVKLKDVFSTIKDIAEIIGVVSGLITSLFTGHGDGKDSKKDSSGNTVYTKEPEQQPA